MTNTTPAKPPRALVIDNDPCICRLLTRHLGGQGWTTVTTSSYSQALELITKGMFDLVLIDAELGDAIGGEEAAQTILELDPDINLTMMSEVSSNADWLERIFIGPLLGNSLKWSKIDALLASRPHPAAAQPAAGLAATL
jgi:CheY-like chemotaxis protein